MNSNGVLTLKPNQRMLSRREEFKMENELYHHGVKGQKWGVRRYQNKDGSLTLAGKKRALKIQNQYSEFSKNKKYRDKDGNLTYTGRKKALKMKEQYSDLTGKSLRKFSNNTGQSSTSIKKTVPKQKSISEMSNEEIQAKIDRIRLENTLNSLTPKQTSAGQKFVDGMKGAAISIAKDKGTKIVGDYIEKQLREKLGLSDKDVKSASKILQEKAQDYENRQKIDKGQKYFKEGKYSESKKTNDTSNENKSANASDGEKNKTWTGTVEGEGTSSKTFHEKHNKSSWKNGPIFDGKWEDVNDNDVNNGHSYVSQFLLEDKKRKR